MGGFLSFIWLNFYSDRPLNPLCLPARYFLDEHITKMIENKTQQQGKGEGDNSWPDKIGVGVLLKSEREKKGLSLNQIFEITMLRPHMLEALENENWNQLPAPVFVVGFARSYAGALGLEEEEIVGLYQEAAQVRDLAIKPHMQSGTYTKRLIPLFFIIVILLAAVSFYFLCKKADIGEKTEFGSKASNPMNVIMMKSEENQEVLNENEITLPAETNPRIIDRKVLDVLLEEERGKKVPTEGLLSLETEPNPKVGLPHLSLKVNIREQTWLRISVDDVGPKEYVFSPGRHYEWKAKTGFELLIGNAGGVDLEYNGKKIEDLGTSGKVVRLRLP